MTIYEKRTISFFQGGNSINSGQAATITPILTAQDIEISVGGDTYNTITVKNVGATYAVDCVIVKF